MKPIYRQSRSWRKASAVHMIINDTNDRRRQTGTIQRLITSPANKAPLPQSAGPTPPAEWTAAATREALLLKLDCRHKFKLLPSKYNGRVRPLPSRHFIHTANTSLLCRRSLEQYKEDIFRKEVGVGYGVWTLSHIFCWEKQGSFAITELEHELE